MLLGMALRALHDVSGRSGRPSLDDLILFFETWRDEWQYGFHLLKCL